MGKRRKPGYDPSEFRSVNIQAILTEDTEAGREAPDLTYRRRKSYESTNEPTDSMHGNADFWIVCPCTQCERDNKPSRRLFSIVRNHVRNNGMGAKYKVSSANAYQTTSFQTCHFRSWNAKCSLYWNYIVKGKKPVKDDKAMELTQVEFEAAMAMEGGHLPGYDILDPPPMDLPAIGVMNPDQEAHSGGSQDDGLETASPWGDAAVIPHVVKNLARIRYDAEMCDVETVTHDDVPYIVQQATTPIYTGSSKSRLHFIIWAFRLQIKNRLSNIAIDDWFTGMAVNVAPKGPNISNNMPRSRAEARKVITECGLDYITIHCCPCDNFIYYGPEFAEMESCPQPGCGLKRYRDDLKKSDVPLKKFHYFPLAPRLQALFRSPTFSRLMQWYYFHRSSEGVLKVPADGHAFRHAEGIFREHAGRGYDIRNVFLSLAMDGFNPHGHNSLSHSTWPVLLSVLNLPPWMSTKASHVILSTIIPGTVFSCDLNFVLREVIISSIGFRE